MTPVTAPQFRSPLRIVSLYVVVSGLWILFSDQLVEIIISDTAQHVLVSTVKGWLFIAITALLLYTFIRRDTQTLRDSEEQYRQLFNMESDAVLLIELATLRLIEVNQAALALYGYSKADLPSLTALDLSAEPDQTHALFENLRAGRVDLHSKRLHRTRTGQIVPVEIANNVFNWHGRAVVCATVRDVTAQQQAEARVRHLNQLYATLSQINQAVVRATDRDTLFREVCRVAIEYGQFRLAWIGLIDESTERVKPFVFAGEEQGYLSQVSIAYKDVELGRGPTGTAIRDDQCVLCQDMAADPRMSAWRTPALERGFRSSAAVPIRQAAQVIGALTVYAGEPHLFDAEEEALLVEIGQTISHALDGLLHETRRRQAEADLQQLNLELEQRVAQRTTELNLANEQLHAKNDELKAFAYTVSHDLKAPLRGISGYAQELDRRHRAGLSDRAQFCLTQIMTATRNLDHLIEDLLHYSRLDTETSTPTRVNLREMIDSLLRDRARLIAEQGTQVEIDLAADEVSAWERGLLQAVTNLIDNALKYSRKAVPPKVSIRGERLATGYRLSVADNGVGFEMKYHDRIFGLFNRLVRADEFEGTGAGLAIAKKAIEKQGGRVWAEAQPGAGATFFIELPAGSVSP